MNSGSASDIRGDRTWLLCNFLQQTPASLRLEPNIATCSVKTRPTTRTAISSERWPLSAPKLTNRVLAISLGLLPDVHGRTLTQIRRRRFAHDRVGRTLPPHHNRSGTRSKDHEGLRGHARNTAQAFPSQARFESWTLGVVACRLLQPS